MILKENYQFIWNIILQSRFDKINQKNIEFIYKDDLSPYTEVNLDDVNSFIFEKNRNNEIPINPFIRFSEIFYKILDYQRSFSDKDGLIKAHYNLIMHLMAEVDMLKGLTKKEFFIKFTIFEIENGKYGDKLLYKFLRLHFLEKTYIAESLLDLLEYQNNLLSFKKATKKIFKDSILYDNKLSQKRLILYINDHENDENINKLDILKFLFLPVGLELKLFWKYHFGVVDVPITMRIDKIAVY